MRQVLSTLLILGYYHSFGQNKLEGKWYTMASDEIKVVEYYFDSATFVRDELNWDLKDQHQTETYRIIGVVKKRQKLYYLFQDTDDTNTITLLLFSSLNPNNSFVQALISEKHTQFKSIDEAMTFINSDTIMRPGLIFYSRREFARIKSLPDVLTITKEKYEKYLQKLIREKTRLKYFASENEDDYDLIFFEFFQNQALQ